MQPKRKENKKHRSDPKASIATNLASTILVQDLIRDIMRDELLKILKSTGDLYDGFLVIPANNL